MHKPFASRGAIRLFARSMMLVIPLSCAAEQYGLASRLVNDSAAHPGSADPTQDSVQELSAGMTLERTLTSGDEHVYTIRLESGGTVLAEADQQGIDLVIDVYDADGKQVAGLNSANG